MVQNIVGRFLQIILSHSYRIIIVLCWFKSHIYINKILLPTDCYEDLQPLSVGYIIRSQPAHIRILDSKMALVHSSRLTKNQEDHKVNVDHLEPGVYLVELLIDGFPTSTQKIIKL